MRTLRFTRLIGAGAFGSVYLADMEGDRGFRRQVAVKLLHENHPNANLFMSRVRDEARLLGLLRDENILEVLGLVNVARRDAVIMEYVEGCDLNVLMEEGHRPPPRAIAELGAAVAGALSRAHRATHPGTGEPLGVIHRDVKPANVMVTARGGVKLLDFGVARARFEARESFTGQHVLGTLNYMAPEYIITGQVSAAADTYGLALTLWEAMAGEVFGQPRLAENLHKARLNERLERVSDHHEALIPLLRRMLTWDPAARPDCAAVEVELLEIADELRGQGLRAWAAESVPPVLEQRLAGLQEQAGLLGQVHPIVDPLGEASGSFPAMRLPEERPASGTPTRILDEETARGAAGPADPGDFTDPTPLDEPPLVEPPGEAAQVVGLEGGPRAFRPAPLEVAQRAPVVGPRPRPSAIRGGSGDAPDARRGGLPLGGPSGVAGAPGAGATGGPVGRPGPSAAGPAGGSAGAGPGAPAGPGTSAGPKGPVAPGVAGTSGGQVTLPSSGSPGSGQAAGVPGTGGPATGLPATGGPATGGPAAGSPVTGGPATGGPATGGPATGGRATGGTSVGGAAGTPGAGLTEGSVDGPVAAPVPRRRKDSGPAITTILGGAAVGIGLGMILVFLFLVLLYLRQ